MFTHHFVFQTGCINLRMDRENEDGMKYYNSNKDGSKLLYKGYIYTSNGKRGQTPYWICEQRSLCLGRFTIRKGIRKLSIAMHQIELLFKCK